jgi:hypothetical protein
MDWSRPSPSSPRLRVCGSVQSDLPIRPDWTEPYRGSGSSGLVESLAVGLRDVVAVGLSLSISLSPFLSSSSLFLPFEVDLVSREEVINVSVLDIPRWGGSCECTWRCTWECAFRCGSMCERCCCGSGSLPLEYLDCNWDWLNMVVWESSEVVGDLLILGRVCRGNALEDI